MLVSRFFVEEMSSTNSIQEENQVSVEYYHMFL